MFQKLNDKLEGILEKGDHLYSPRFCDIAMEEVYSSTEELSRAGYNECTYIKSDNWDVRGKSLDQYHMLFAAAPKKPIFEVEITETSQKTFKVLAKNASEAEYIAEQRYYDPHNYDYVLKPDDLVATEFHAVAEGGERS